MNITKEGEDMARITKKSYMIVRTVCCGKKRKSTQCTYKDTTGDGGTWVCAKGFGCKKEHYL